jgi:hypothetical protein
MPDWSLPAALGVGAIALCIWNFSTGRRLSTLSAASRGFRVLSGLGAFLLLPALFIGLLAPTAPGVRVLGPLAWLWPLVTVILAVQAIWAIGIARGGRLSTVIIAAFNLLVAWVATTRWIASIGGALPAWALAPGDAVSILAAFGLGNAAFPWGAGLLMPAIAPAAPARSRTTRVFRALLATGCACVVGFTALELPPAARALRTAGTLATVAPDSGARGELSVGLRVFGALGGLPSGVTARRDMALADSLGLTALHVELHPSAATAAVLDSIARSVEPRRDSLTLVVTLTLGGRAAPGTGDTERARLALIDRIVRRLHPDVLLPAERVTHGEGAPSVDGWRAYYDHAAIAARRVDQDITVALATDASSPADSALADWVMTGRSRVDAVAIAVRDGGADPLRFIEALNAAARWAALARVRPDVWVVGVPSAPLVSGEAVQEQLVRHALAWGAARAWVRGVIAGDASDVAAATGVRTASGRPRRALAEVAAALRAQRDAPRATAPDSLPRADSTRRGVRVISSDTLPPPV